MTPSLIHDAPGLTTDLRALFPHDFGRLEEIYEYSAAHGATAEGPVVRTEGVSFNPRPARVVSIVLKGTRAIDLLTTGAGFLICCKRTSLEDDSLWEQEKTLAFEALTSPSNSERASLLSLAHALDCARHLHMTSYSKAERVDVAKGLAERTKDVLQTPSTLVLLNLLANALKRYV